jgi:hypothetical protein
MIDVPGMRSKTMEDENDSKHFLVLREEIRSLERATSLQFQSHAREHDLIDRALEESKHTLSVRLENMNEFRKQLTQERGEYVRFDDYTHYHESVVDRITKAENSLERLRTSVDTRLETRERDSSKTFLWIGLGVSTIFNVIWALEAVFGLFKK